MQDRISKFPGRVRLTPVDGQESVFDLVRADEPEVEGTPLNKANILTDETALLLGFEPNDDPNINDAFTRNYINARRVAYSVGNYLTFVGNVNEEMVTAAFGKNNAEHCGVGKALALYAYYKGTATNIDLSPLYECDTLLDVISSDEAYALTKDNEYISNLINSNAYAREYLSALEKGMNFAKAMGITLDDYNYQNVYTTVFESEELTREFFANKQAMQVAYEQYDISANYIVQSPYFSEAFESPYYTQTTMSYTIHAGSGARQVHYEGKAFILGLSQSYASSSSYKTIVDTLGGAIETGTPNTYDTSNSGLKWRINQFANGAKCHPYVINGGGNPNLSVTATSVMTYIKID